MISYLVTGGAGFIGGNFVHRLAGRGQAVCVLDKLTYAANPLTLTSLQGRSGFELRQGDIGDSAAINDALQRSKPRYVVNFAAESHVDRSIDGPAAFVETNVTGTLVLLEAVLAYWRALPEAQAAKFRFLHVSTDEVYGSLGPEGYFSEQSQYAPNSPYAASKASSDHLVRAFHHTYGLPVLTTNCSNNYGPYQFPEKLIPLITIKALRGQPLPVYGDGSNVRDWLQVGDHCAAIEAVLERGRVGEVYNVGGNAERSNIEVVHAICDALDQRQPASAPRRSLIEFVTDRPGHDRRYAIDASKIRDELGWKPTMSFEQGLAETIDWYLSNSHWWQSIEDGSYQGERLGLQRAEAGA